MRLELKEGINQCQVIDDTYNNDLAGLQISLDFLNHQSQKANKTLILSDVLQSGLHESELTDQIAQLVNQSGVQKFIGIGPSLARSKKKFLISSLFFHSVDEFLKSKESNSFQQEVILVKGARIFQFEKIVSHLQRKVHGTIMEVDLGALVYNLNYFKSKLQANTKVMVMVKAFVMGAKCPTRLDSTKRYLPTVLWAKSALWFSWAVMEPLVAPSRSHGTLKLVTVMEPSVNTLADILPWPTPSSSERSAGITTPVEAAAQASAIVAAGRTSRTASRASPAMRAASRIIVDLRRRRPSAADPWLASRPARRRST